VSLWAYQGVRDDLDDGFEVLEDVFVPGANYAGTSWL
jgi:hypothetical protein